MDGDGWKNFFNRVNFKLGLRHWIGTLIVAIVAGFVIFGLLRGQEFLASFLADRETNRIIKELEKPYREDKYGGKTPEDTFDLFLEALRKEDIELASKYFELEKQEKWMVSLQKIKTDNLISDFIKNLEENRNKWRLESNDGVKAVYVYDYLVETPFVEELPISGGRTQKLVHPAGIFEAEIIFGKNQLSKAWKLVQI